MDAILGKVESNQTDYICNSDRVIIGKKRFNFVDPVTHHISDTGSGFVPWQLSRDVAGRYYYCLLIQRS